MALGRGQDQSGEKALSEVPKAVLPQETSDIEKAIAEKASHISEYKKIPLGEIATLGGVFAQLSPALSKMYPVKWTHELATNPNCVHLKR